MEDFFDTPYETTEIKIKIVVEYFRVWASIMNVKSIQPRLGYIDLYSGKGVFKDGTESTPVLIMREILKNETFRNQFQCFFNDKDEINIKELHYNHSQLPDFDKLKFSPQYEHSDVLFAFEEVFNRIDLVPSLIFLDPFGIKGLSKKLFKGLGKNFGCDIISFFNYSYTTRSVKNVVMNPHINGLLGEKDASELRGKLANLEPHLKEKLIIRYMVDMLKKVGLNYSMPFRIVKSNNIIYYLIFSAKHPTAVKAMKKVMNSNCTFRSFDPTAFYVYDVDKKSASRELIDIPSAEFEQYLIDKYKGIKTTIKDLYENDFMNTPFVDNEYKALLNRLYTNGRLEIISTKKPKGKTFADDIEFIIQ